MKASALLAAGSLGFAAIAASSGAVVGGDTQPDTQPIGIKQAHEPIFPVEATEEGYAEGVATVLISVDAAGRLTDALPVVYDHLVFAEAALRTVQHWSFSPALSQGHPVAAIRQVNFHFRQQGPAIVVETVSENVQQRIRDVEGDFDACHPWSIREIDGALTPIRMPPPIYPSELEAAGVRGTVQLLYFVDPTGRVRMPVAVNEAPDPLVKLALDAVSQWRFAPPTRRGKPALVEVRESIGFNAK